MEETMERDAFCLIEAHLEELLKEAEKVCYKRGQVIFYEGHHPCGIYFLKKGKVSLTQNGASGKIEPIPNPTNAVFGLFHLVTESSHCATATAKSDVEALFVSKASVLQFLQGRKGSKS